MSSLLFPSQPSEHSAREIPSCRGSGTTSPDIPGRSPILHVLLSHKRGEHSRHLCPRSQINVLWVDSFTVIRNDPLPFAEASLSNWALDSVIRPSRVSRGTRLISVACWADREQPNTAKAVAIQVKRGNLFHSCRPCLLLRVGAHVIQHLSRSDAVYPTISVPTPSFVNISSKRQCKVLPSTMCVFFTPASRARVHA